ncbi:hypothetical protein [Gorillibacterium sp. sgz500922]|uniref:hypothetical protein n=1 Tax=Gorillibacterium sp. sgz500922 TaxID=3446694 RepID=UPI003F678A3A
MNSRNQKILVLFLIVALAGLSLFFMLSDHQNNKKRHELQSRIDQTFVYQVGETEAALNRDLSEPSEYPKLVSQLSALSALSSLTSYADKNMPLNGSLYSLYMALLKPENKQEMANPATLQPLREALKQMHENPVNPEAANKLSELSSRLLNQ